MSKPVAPKCRWIPTTLIVAGVFFCSCQLTAQTPDTSGKGKSASTAVSAEGSGKLQFSFDGTSWRDVIKWLAKESGLALHVGDLPTGSFTYSDPNTFTMDKAIDRVNLFLLAEGFTLVRSGKLLSVINLSDPRSIQQLDALAELVTVNQLDELSTHTVAKCFFPLGEFAAEDAVEELSALKLMTTPAVFKKTNQLLITDTVARLKNVKAVLSVQPAKLDNGTVMRSIKLKFVDAEDILAVARPHLGLATGEMIGIDVSLSADLQGKNIFVTGVGDKVKLIEGLVESIDIPEKSLSTADGKTELRSHVVSGGNVETIYNVLQTLLAGKSIRLSMDKATSSIVALATPEIQKEIEQTVEQLQASDAEFEVIPLKTVDPYFAISLLEQMLAPPTPITPVNNYERYDRDDRRRRSSPEPPAPVVEPPKFDADPGNRRLFVRGTRSQIDQAKKIVAALDVGNVGNVGSNDAIRMLPYKGKQAARLLETVAKFWRGENPIILFPSSQEAEDETERVVNGVSTKQKITVRQPEIPPTARYLTDNIRSQASPIRCQVTERGLLLQCDDTSALDKLEEQLRAIAGPGELTAGPPVVFYLKYTKPEDALRMLAELLDGGESAKEGEAGTLVNGFVTAGTYLGSIVTSRQGTTTMIADTITVVADSRLNRLIAQGTRTDIDRIERYLKIVDKDTSLTTIETHGKSHVIELVHSRASEVAAAIRDAYADRVAAAASGAQTRQLGSRQPAAREAPARRTEGGKEDEQGENKKTAAAAKKPAGGQAKDLEPKMTIAVHEPSNSLIVTAQDQLFKEVEQLAKLLDTRSEQSFQVIAPSNANAVQSLLQQAFSSGGGAGIGASPAQSATPRASSSQFRTGGSTGRTNTGRTNTGRTNTGTSTGRASVPTRAASPVRDKR